MTDKEILDFAIRCLKISLRLALVLTLPTHIFDHKENIDKILVFIRGKE